MSLKVRRIYKREGTLTCMSCNKDNSELIIETGEYALDPSIEVCRPCTRNLVNKLDFILYKIRQIEIKKQEKQNAKQRHDS